MQESNGFEGQRNLLTLWSRGKKWQRKKERREWGKKKTKRVY
jgi:hypothetical protein